MSTCPSGALTLKNKEHPRVPPKNRPTLDVQLYRDRYGLLGLAAAAAKNLLGMNV